MIVVEKDGDEIFTPMHMVQCCHLGFDCNGKSIYSKIIPVERNNHIWMCCDTCGGSYGEQFNPNH